MGTFVVKWICSKIIPSMGCLYELGLIFRPTLWPALVILGSKFSINVTRKVDWSSLFRNFSGICRGSIFDVSKNAACIVCYFRSTGWTILFFYTLNGNFTILGIIFWCLKYVFIYSRHRHFMTYYHFLTQATGSSTSKWQK